MSASPLVFKYLAYNILHDGIDIEYDWIQVAKEENADIIVLSETGGWGKDNNKLLKQNIAILNNYFTDEDPYEGYTAQGSNPDCAILSRFPIVNATDVEYITLDSGEQVKPYYDFLHAVVAIGGTTVHIIGYHFRCCGEFDGSPEGIHREQDQEGIINYLDTLGSVPIIYSGDFNSYSPFDVGDLKPNVANLGAGPITMLLNNSDPHASKIHSWVDVFRELNPSHPGFSYIDWMYKSRIDFIFVNDFFFDKLINSTVGNSPTRIPSESSVVGSDHFPVDACFNMNPSIADLRPPLLVTGVNGTVLNSTSINITWTPSPEQDFSYYNIYRDGVNIAQTSLNEYTDTALTPNVIHRYHLSAVDNSSNEGFKSDLFIVNTSYGICSPPSPPVLTATGGEFKITLSWNEAFDDGGLPIMGFYIYRVVVDSVDNERIVNLVISYEVVFLPPEQTEYVIVGRTPGKNYTYIVTALNELGESPFLNRATASALPRSSTETTSETTTTGTPYDGSITILTLLVLTFIGSVFKRRQQRY